MFLPEGDDVIASFIFLAISLCLSNHGRSLILSIVLINLSVALLLSTSDFKLNALLDTTPKLILFNTVSNNLSFDISKLPSDFSFTNPSTSALVKLFKNLAIFLLSSLVMLFIFSLSILLFCILFTISLTSFCVTEVLVLALLPILFAFSLTALIILLASSIYVLTSFVSFNSLPLEKSWTNDK